MSFSSGDKDPNVSYPHLEGDAVKGNFGNENEVDAGSDGYSPEYVDSKGDYKPSVVDMGGLLAKGEGEEDEEAAALRKQREEEEDKARNLPKHKLIMLSLSCFFVVVATVLGTGILALPVKVSTSGFWPFFTSFFFCLVAQIFIIMYMVELLQRTQAIQTYQQQQQQTEDGDVFVEEETAAPADDESNLATPITGMEAPQYGTGAEDDMEGGALLGDEQPVFEKESKLGILSTGPDLHAMGTFFLDWKILRFLFEFAVLIHFISILISYSLGGTLAYAQFFGIMGYHTLLIPPFVIVLAAIVVLLQKFIQQVISLVTLAKGGLLVVMVMLVGVIGIQIGRSSTSEWLDIGNPFLISTVALGGAINTLPVIYGKIQNPSKQTIRWFRFGAVAGITTCWLINVMWVLFILLIVPQTGPRPSLEYSNENGEISTISLIEIIQKDFPEYNWLAVLVQVFIMISITVSFVTISSGMKHMLDGYVKSFSNAVSNTNGRISQLADWLERKSPRGIFSKTKLQPLVLQFSLYIVFFASILIIALFNPKSFLAVMEVFTSMSLNMEAGLFIAIMMFRSRSLAKYKHIKIPLPMSKYLTVSIWPVAAYFLFACVFAQYVAIKNYFGL